MTSLKAGTRGSELARWQTAHVIGLLKATPAAPAVETVVITTRGDVDMADRLAGKLEKGFFTEELEQALRDGGIDFAVHSLKDLPTRLPEGLAVGAVLPRADVFDLLITRPEVVQPRGPLSLPLRDGATVGASSLRRDALIRRYGPSLKPEPLRGNVPTRVQRLREGKKDAILLAAAGVRRLQLNLEGLVVFELNPRRWVPAPGQGAVAVECRAGDERVLSALSALHHAPTALATALERDFLKVLEGGCATPFGCYAHDGTAHLGLALDGRFPTWAATLPSEAPGVDFIRAALSTPTEGLQHDDWLYREV